MSGAPSGPGGHGNGGRLRRHQRQVERRRPTDLGRELDHTRVAQEPAGLLGTAAQVRAGRGRQPRVELVEAAPGAHRGDRGGQPALRGRGVVHVVGGDAAHVVAGGQLGQRVVAHRVERVAVVPQLDQHPVAPEQLDQPCAARGPRPRGPSCDQRRRAPHPCGTR